MSTDLDFIPDASGTSRWRGYVLKVLLTPADVIDRIRDNTDPEGVAVPDAKKPFHGTVSADEFRIRSKQLDRPKGPSPLVAGRVCPCADGAEIHFAINGPAGFLGALLVVGAVWGFVAGIAVAYCVTGDAESGLGYFLFSGLFAVGALALVLASGENRERIKIEFVTLFEAEAYCRPLRARTLPHTRSEVVNAMLRKLGPARAQLLRTIRTGALVCVLCPGLPLLGGFFYAWPALRRLDAQLEELRALKAADVEAVFIYRDAHGGAPLATVTDGARLHELFGAFGQIDRSARFRPSDYTASFHVVFRYRDGRSENWELRLKGTLDDGLYLNRPAGEERSSFRLSSSYYRVPRLRSWLETVEARKARETGRSSPGIPTNTVSRAPGSLYGRPSRQEPHEEYGTDRGADG
jgi:hypothetical protein